MANNTNLSDYTHGNTKKADGGDSLSTEYQQRLLERHEPVIDRLLDNRYNLWLEGGRKGKRPSRNSIVRDCVNGYLPVLEKQELKPVAV